MSVERTVRSATPALDGILTALALLVLVSPTATDADEARRVVVSPVQEMQLGQRDRDRFLASHPLSADGQLAIRVDEIGRVVARTSERPGVIYRFLVVQGEEIQAWSFVGGTVCVSEGLARLDDGELAFGIGHELAHVALRHHVQRYRLWTRAGGNDGSHDATLDDFLVHHDQDQELEADRYGALFAVRAGYDFSDSISALSRLVGAGAPPGDRIHPDYGERIDALRDFATELQLTLRRFHVGTEALRHGDPDEAIESLTYFVRQFPQSVSGRINLGAAYLARVRSSSPLDLAEILPILPDPGIAIRGAYDRIDLEQAKQQFELALENEPTEVFALAGLALVHLRLGDPDEARAALDRALELAPRRPDLLLLRGNVDYLFQEFDRAEIYYRAALAELPGWSAALKNLALTNERTGRLELAIALWETLVADPDLREEAVYRLRDLREAAAAPELER